MLVQLVRRLKHFCMISCWTGCTGHSLRKETVYTFFNLVNFTNLI